MLETNTAEPATTDDAVWPPASAYVLLAGGLTMVFLAASTIASAPAMAIPGLLAPTIVALGLGLQRRVDLRAYIGTRLRADVTAMSTVFGPFLVVLAMVISGEPRRIDMEASVIWTAALAGIAELGWWGYLYPLLRQRLQPLPAALAVGVVRIGWYGLLAWAGTNPLAGASPALLVGWSLSLAFLTAGILEFEPRSVVPVVLLHLGLNAAIGVLPFAPVDSGTNAAMRTGALLMLAAGVITMITARGEAVARARHARGEP